MCRRGKPGGDAEDAAWLNLVTCKDSECQEISLIQSGGAMCHDKDDWAVCSRDFQLGTQPANPELSGRFKVIVYQPKATGGGSAAYFDDVLVIEKPAE